VDVFSAYSRSIVGEGLPERRDIFSRGGIAVAPAQRVAVFSDPASAVRKGGNILENRVGGRALPMAIVAPAGHVAVGFDGAGMGASAGDLFGGDGGGRGCCCPPAVNGVGEGHTAGEAIAGGDARKERARR